MKKLLFVSLAVVLSSASAFAASVDKDQLVGIWAMKPLNNGIANVVEFTADGKSNLHPFNCEEPSPSQPEVEVSDYRISEDGKTIQITSPYQSFDLQVLSFALAAMQLGMEIEGHQLQFSYLKRDKIESLCAQ
ncbi:hypothetical protein VUJ49_00315 [Pseudomonas berkeleyensis]|uniref:DUF2147 domain-containing protein n=1 Tax=Pseudomonas berkeleyensis TaxID=2726956 RepID=A0A7G5DP56_9PSED|nr:hypothetical protein [Pseudomonas berkeleyensis]QMV63531.1 hypothetical protein HS968_00315 [Pseudomonas berkeleyensis]WSO38997.1 hypothetical protein VUJ49_00315 [Pseudomonas berkeleyensis]